jgi:hypothetical protein
MKLSRLLLSLAAAATFSLAACNTAPVAGTQNEYDLPQIRLTDVWLDGKVHFERPIVVLLPGGLSKIDVTCNNVSDDNLHLEYKTTFLIDGAAVDVPTSYTPIDIPRGTSAHIIDNSTKAIPPSPHGDFKVEIRRRHDPR